MFVPSIHGMNGTAAGGDDQFVIRFGIAILGKDELGSAEQACGAHARQKTNVVLLVPGQRVQINVVFVSVPFSTFERRIRL